MNFDHKTILLTLLINYISIIVIFSFIIIVKQFRRWFLISYLVGNVFHTVGLLGVIEREIISDFLSLHVSNLFLLLGFAIIPFSILSFDGIFRRKLFFSLVSVSILFFIARTVFSDNMAFRSVMQSTGSFIIFLISGIVLFIRKKKLIVKYIIGLCFTIFAVFQLIRVFFILKIGEDYSFFDDSWIDSMFLIITIFTSNIANIGFILLLLEINEKELSQKNEVIAEEREKLHILNQTKDKFFSIIAHDLRSPIGTITEMIAFINTEYRDNLDEKVKSMFDALHTSSKNTFTLLENLLSWARSQSGIISFNPQQYNIQEIVEKNINLISGRAHDKSINIINEITNSVICCIDEEMIDTVMRNLLSNAIKYTPENGEIRISCIKELDLVKVSVHDSGIGISQEIIDKLFRVSDVKVVKKGTKGEKGTGLGLILCKEFIDRHRGDIWAESNLNYGSIFYFTLPC